MAHVSVLISAYNEELYIEASIQSILQQSYQDFEILIADDGSSDGTLNKIQRFTDNRIHITKQSNRGKAATLNSLLSKASGEYILIQDGDDISAPNRIEAQLAKLEEEPNLALVLAGHSLIINNNEVAPKSKALSQETCKKMIDCLQLPAHDPTLFTRLSIAKEFMFDESLRIGQGVDFIFRIAEKYPIEVMDTVLYKYRIHVNSITKKDPKAKAERLFEVMNKAKKRRNEPLWSFEEFLNIHKKWVQDKDNNLSGHFTESAYTSVIKGHRIEAIKTALTSLALIGRNKSYLKPAIYAVLPAFICIWGKNKFGN